LEDYALWQCDFDEATRGYVPIAATNGIGVSLRGWQEVVSLTNCAASRHFSTSAGTRMWPSDQAVDRHPVLAVGSFAVLAGILFRAQRRMFADADAPVGGFATALVVGSVILPATSFAFVMMSSSMRTAPNRSVLLLALAASPVVLTMGASAAGVAGWASLVGLSTSLLLVGVWAARGRR
jgi:hypothetical protein